MSVPADQIPYKAIVVILIVAVQSEEPKKFRKQSRHQTCVRERGRGEWHNENRSEKKKLDGNSFLLTVTIILFFAMYIQASSCLAEGFAKVQNFLNLFISNAG